MCTKICRKRLLFFLAAVNKELKLEERARRLQPSSYPYAVHSSLVQKTQTEEWEGE